MTLTALQGLSTVTSFSLFLLSCLCSLSGDKRILLISGIFLLWSLFPNPNFLTCMSSCDVVSQHGGQVVVSIIPSNHWHIFSSSVLHPVSLLLVHSLNFPLAGSLNAKRPPYTSEDFHLFYWDDLWSTLAFLSAT